ncbi:ion transporter [Flavobacteriales bacterium]|nr:ion transporter [Flavobacteriales bacterium]
MKNTKHKIGLILNDDTPETPLKKRVGLFILFLILVSSFEVILESVVSLNVKYHHHFFIIDAAVSILFSIEYILRLWTYRIDGEKPTLKQRFSNITSFYMVIDLISIIPFYLSLFIPTGYGFIRIVRILRLFRLMKFGRYMKSQNLVVNAIKNKGKELILSMQVVVFLTVILSALLYHIENSAQPDKFGDIIDAFVWSLSKFIGGVGGYGDFEPITFWGQVMATIVGLLGIALFAVPAGIIGAGFVEEIEAIKQDEEIATFNQDLLDLFEFDHLGSFVRAKEEIGLPDLRRKVLKLNDAKMRLMLSEEEIFHVAKNGKGIRLKNYISDGKENLVLESFDENTKYGTLVDRQSSVTVLSSNSDDQPFLGHYSYALSEYLKANYISVEKFSFSNFNKEKRLDFTKQEYYNDQTMSVLPVIKTFCNDLKEVIKSESLVIDLRCGGKNVGEFHFLNGGKIGEKEFVDTNSHFPNVKSLDLFKDIIEKEQKQIDEESETFTHQRYGSINRDEIQWYIHKQTNSNVLVIFVSARILNAKAIPYFKSFEVLGKAIKETLM